jgi:hypothetical protein
MTMKIQTIKSRTIIKQFLSAVILVGASLTFLACDSDDPEKEDVPELITKVTLTFTPNGGGSAVVVTATDPDGLGLQPLEVDGSIVLAKNTSYSLAVTLINELAEPSAPEYNITEEVSEEGDEHMFFFAWTGNVFSNPAGNGNVDNRNDAVNYDDEDVNGLPLGLATSWTSTDATASGSFRVILKHQPELKTSVSDSSVGETDLDIPFEISVE